MGHSKDERALKFSLQLEPIRAAIMKFRQLSRNVIKHGAR